MALLSQSSSEQLVRDEDFIIAFKQWQSNGDRTRALRQVREIYESSFFGNGDPRCDLIRTSTYAVFVLYFGEDFRAEELAFLMDHTQEVLLSDDYYNYMSDLRTGRTNPETVRTIERHYLKPKGSLVYHLEPDVDRRYGNISAEVVYNNQQPDYFKLHCNYYQGRGVKKELPIDKLMERILKQ